MILDFLTQNLAIPMLIQQGDLSTSFIYNILNFLTPIYEYITYNASGVNYLALFVGIFMFMYAYYRGHANAFKEFSTFKRHPVILSTLTVVLLSVLLMPMKLIFVSISEIDANKLNVITEMSISSDTYIHRATELNNVPGVIAFPILAFNRYVYGVSHYRYPEGDKARIIPIEYNRFLNAGNVNPGAPENEIGFHLGSLFDGNIHTNYSLVDVIDYLDFVRNGMSQIFVDGDDLTNARDVDVGLTDRIILASIKSEIDFYKKVHDTALDGYIKGHPLYKDFINTPENIMNLQAKGSVDLNQLFADADAEVYGSVIPAYLVGDYNDEALTGILNSCRVTAPNLHPMSADGLKREIKKIENSTNSSADQQKSIKNLCENLFIKGKDCSQHAELELKRLETTTEFTPAFEFELPSELFKPNHGATNCKAGWDLIDTHHVPIAMDGKWTDTKIDLQNSPFYKACMEPKSEDFDKKKEEMDSYTERGFSSKPQNVIQVLLMKDSLVEICNASHASQDFSAAWDEDIGEYTEILTSKMQILSDAIVEYENQPIKTPPTKLLQASRDSRGASPGSEVDKSKYLRSISNLNNLYPHDGFSINYNTTDSNKLGDSSLSSKDSNKFVLTDIAIPTGTGEHTLLRLKKYLTILSYKGRITKSTATQFSDINNKKIYLDHDYPKCGDDGLDLSKKLIKMTSAGTSKIDQYYSDLNNLMIGGDKNKILGSTTNHRPSEDLIRSIFYAAKINNLIKSLTNPSGTNTIKVEETINKINEIAAAAADTASAANTDFEVNVCDLFDDEADNLPAKITKGTIAALGLNNIEEEYAPATKTPLTSNQIGRTANAQAASTAAKNYRSQQVNNKRIYSAINILNYVSTRVDDHRPTDPAAPTLVSMKAAINISDMTLIPYFADIWLAKDSDPKNLAYDHLEMKDYNLIRPLSFAIGGKQISSISLSLNTMSDSNYDKFKKEFLDNRYEEFRARFQHRSNMFTEAFEFGKSALKSFYASAKKAVSSIMEGDILEAGASLITDIAGTGLQALIRTIGLTLSDWMFLPEINKFLNNMVINFISMITVANLSFADDGYKHPTVQAAEYSESGDKIQMARYSSYLSAVAAPITSSNTAGEYTRSSYFLTAVSPGMFIPNNWRNSNSSILNEIYVKVGDLDINSWNGSSVLLDRNISFDLYRSGLYNSAISLYHVTAVERYQDFIKSSAAASDMNSGSYWNMAYAAASVATTAFPVFGALKAGYAATSAVGGIAQLGLREATKTATKAIGKKIATKSLYYGKKAATAMRFAGKNLVGMLNGMPFIIILIILLPILLNLLIIFFLFRAAAKSINYLFMSKVLPLVYFFGSILKTLAQAIFGKIPKTQGRIDTAFGNALEGPIVSAFVPLFRLTLELTIFYFLFSGIFVYVLNNHFNEVAIYMYVNSYYELFEAGVSVVIVITLWITMFIYDLMDRFYPMEYTKEIQQDMDRMKY
jgi:hypothetical protein